MDKNKIIEGAAKLVAKGAYDKAIKEYQKILDADPKDVRILQKMGELYQKKNDNAQAANYFTKVAESYSSDGFFLKAVALYKQVLKLNPNLVDINLKLAELHQQLQLMSEAMAYYQIVANHYDKAGDTKSSLDTLKKMVDLDPDNVASRIKLAELYARENMNAQALPEFKRAAEYLQKNNRTDDYLRVAERLSALEPANVQLARELSASYLQKGDQKRALAKLQICFKADPRDVETLGLLAQAFEGLGQTSKTLSVYKELAKIQEEKGKTSEARDIWAKIEKLDPGDPDLAARRGASAPAPAPAPARPAPAAPAPASAAPAPARATFSPAAAAAAPAPVAASSSGGGLPREQLAKLLTETDVYVKYGLHDKALEHLRKIFGVDPENLDAHEKAYQIYVSSNNEAQAAEQLLNVLRLCTRRGDVERGQSYLNTILQQNPDHPEVPAFLAALRPGGEDEEGRSEGVGEDAILVDSNDEEIIVADAPEDALAPEEPEDLALQASSADDDVVEEVVSDESVVVSEELEDEPISAEVTGEELGGEDLGSAEMVSEDVVEEVIEDSDETREHQSPGSYELEDEPTTQAGMPPVPMAPPAPTPASSRAMPVASARSAPPLAKAPPAPTRPAPAAAAKPAPKPAPPVEEEDPAGSECDEAAFFLDQGLIEEAREILDTLDIAYPGHARAAELRERLDELERQGATEAEPVEDAAPPPMVSPLESADTGERDAFDLAAELADELGEEPAEAEPLSAAGDDFQYSVEEVFSEFKKGLEKVVKPEDVDTHYDLGIAYKEMGLLDDAIGEFTVARQGCMKKKKEVDCLTMIAMLQSMKGEHGAAVDTLKQALLSEHAVGEVLKALEFELGTAWEANGSAGKALFHFQKVAKLDPKFRDASAVVVRLAAVTKPEDDPLPKVTSNGVHGRAGNKPEAGAVPDSAGQKSRKVGYV